MNITFNNWIKVASMLWLLPGVSYAAPSGSVLPGSADPGRILEDLKPVPEPRLEAPPVAPTLLENAAPAGAENTLLYVKEVRLEGVTAYAKNIFAPLWEPYLKQYDSLRILYQIAASITKRYHDDGYALSLAVVLPQDASDGVVRIRVIEGYIDHVETQGTYRETAVTRGIIERLRHYRPLNMKDLERDVLLLNDLGGVAVQAVLKPAAAGDPPGALGLVLVFKDTPYGSSVSVDNEGSRYLGPAQFGFATGANLLPYQQTTLSGLVTSPVNNLQFVQASHRMTLDSEGTALTLQGNYAHSEPGYKLTPERIDSDALDYGFTVSHPFIRSRAQNLTISGGLDVKDIDTDALYTRLYDDRLRVINVSASYDLSDGWKGANLAQATLSQGLDILGATHPGDTDLSRAGGQSDFTKLDANVSRLQTLTDNVRLYAAATGQYAWAPLLSSEQFGFGGQQFGRGYDPSELTGDDGMAGTIELRYAPPLQIPRFSSELFGFYDIGQVWNYGAYGQMESAASTGVGVRFSIDPHLTGSLVLAKPLTHSNSAPEYGGGKAPQLYFSLNAKF